MNTPTKGIKRAQKYLEALEDWQPDHNAAMQCYEVEDWMAEGLGIFQIIRRITDRFRQAAYRGLVVLSAEDTDNLRQLFHIWLERAETGLAALADLEATFGEVKRAEEFRAAYESARQYADNWPPVVRSEMLAAHHEPMSELEAGQVREILAAEPGQPGTLSRPVARTAPGNAALIR